MIEKRENGAGRRGADQPYSLVRELFFTARGWATVVTILTAGAGLVAWTTGLLDIPERTTQVEASTRALEASRWALERDHASIRRSVNWLACVNPEATPDRLALLGVECWKLPPAALPDGP
jgi:hypothetical protein